MRTVVITGASSGLGARLAEGYAAAGDVPVLFARSRERLDAVAARCRAAGAEPLVVAGDVTDPRDCARLVADTVARHGGIDVLVACAGIGMWARFDELRDPDVLRRVMDVNYHGLVNTVFAALPQLKESRGVFIAISSVQGAVGVPYHTGYAASKHAVQGFCDSLRMELSGSGVSVMTVLAHWIAGTELRRNSLGGDGAPRGGAAHAHRGGALPAEVMARRIIAAADRRRRTLHLPSWTRLLAVLSVLAPAVADRLIARRVDREASR